GDHAGTGADGCCGLVHREQLTAELLRNHESARGAVAHVLLTAQAGLAVLEALVGHAAAGREMASESGGPLIEGREVLLRLGAAWMHGASVSGQGRAELHRANGRAGLLEALLHAVGALGSL